jgi:hypothetical protein
LNVNIEPIAATITQFSTCDENGQEKYTFASDEKRIFVCGQIETAAPVDLSINWYYKDQLVFQQFGKNAKDGHFYNFVEPSKSNEFPEGKYRVEILVGNVVAESSDFWVEKSE